MRSILLVPFFIGLLLTIMTSASGQSLDTVRFMVDLTKSPQPYLNISMQIESEKDTLTLKMPRWTPGYYQYMPYAASVEVLHVSSNKENFSISHPQGNSWKVPGAKDKWLEIRYRVKTTNKFIAKSYIDSAHAYIVGAHAFLYPESGLNRPVKVRLTLPENWEVATGLQREGSTADFVAEDYDRLYDCPVLAGPIEKLPSFEVRGIPHSFEGLELGEFDREQFIQDLQKIVQASTDIIGEIPYASYTFIAVGPGRGGIEHLNNTTVSFNGNDLNDVGKAKRMFSFLAHEHFHHFNVKRIRPYELGPFDYENGSRTNLLWVSEGITNYYDKIIPLRAGILSSQEFLSLLSDEIKALQQNPGRKVQSVRQASYHTWVDGPFGGQKGKTVSVYNKGAVLGMLLDLAIRYHSENKKSLDDVMRTAYYRYYKERERGFTDAEFESLCNETAGADFAELFEYVYTTKEINYEKYLGYAGLVLESGYSIVSKSTSLPDELKLRKDWLSE